MQGIIAHVFWPRRLWKSGKVKIFPLFHNLYYYGYDRFFSISAGVFGGLIQTASGNG
jgi:hypothetical protein